MSILWLGIVGLFICLWFARFIHRLMPATSAAPQANINSTKKNRILSVLYDDKDRYPAEQISRKSFWLVFLLALCFRLLIYLVAYVALCLQVNDTHLTLESYLTYWSRWDSPNYITLAEQGYRGFTENGQHLFLVFFPLYPWCIRLMHLFIGNWQIAALAVTNLAYALGCAFLYATLSEEYSRSIAYKSIVLMSLYPFAFFYGSIHTESLFFLTMAAGFYYTKKHKWFTVGFIGILCALCRVQGIILMGVAGVEFLLTYSPIVYLREKKIAEYLKILFTKGIGLLLVPIGNLLYFALNYYVEGDPFRFQVYQREHWFHTPILFTKSLAEIYGGALAENYDLSMRFGIWIPELVLFVITILALFYGLRRHPLKYTAYLLVYTLINYSVTFLISGGRYMLCAFPLYFILGEWSDRHPKAYPWILAMSSMLMMIYTIGFFNWKQIM